MKIIAATLVALITATAVAAPAQAASPPVFKSCKALNAAYSNGVARDDAASRAVQAQGYKVPAVGAGIYWKNARRLDKDGDGVLCPVKIALVAPTRPPTAGVVYLPTGLILADALYGSQAKDGTLNAAQAKFPFIWTTTLSTTNPNAICLAWTDLSFRDTLVNGVLTPEQLAKMELSDKEVWAKDSAKMLTAIFCTARGFKYSV